MKQHDLNLINGTLILPEGRFSGSIGIQNGCIAQIVSFPGALRPAVKELDASGLFIFPGVIDTHTHIRGEAFSYREDFYTGTCAAACGGVTTILEMPGSTRPASTAVYFREKLANMEKYIGIDAALYAGAGYDNLDEIPSLAAAGAIGFKTFLMPPVPGRETEFYGMCAETDEQLTAVMALVAKTGLTLTLHCEEDGIVQRETARIMAAGGTSVRDYCQSRPPQAEIAAVERALRCAQRTGCAVNIAHVSTPEAAALIQTAWAAGLNVMGETSAHYLTFDSDSMDAYDVFARMKPPLRDRGRVEGLQRAYADGALSYTGSDHAPFTPEEKRSGGSIWNTFDGLAGIEMTLPLLLNLARSGAFSYETITRNTTWNPAQRFRLPNKGRLAEGYDADLVLVQELDVPDSFSHTQLHSKHTESGCIYESISFSTRVSMTLSRGRIVYDGRHVRMAPGSGNLILSGGNHLC